MRKIPNPSDFKAAFCRRTYCNQKQIGGIFIAKLVVAEKPSVAMSYAKVLGATSRKDGYLEGNGYLVSWCIGHLVELAPPNVYDAKYVKWSIKSFLSRQKETYKIPYETHPADRKRQCVFGGSSNTLDFLPLDRTGNRRFVPVMVYPERAEVHILADEQASREYINQMWAEAMEIYRSGNFRLRFSPAMNAYLKAHQKDFMPEDTKAGQILDYLERYSGSMVCSKQLYKEALGHDYDEPKQWELREINDIMNNAVTGWRAFSNPRYFPEPYRRQKGWERIRNDNEPDNSMDGFQEIPTEEMEQLGLPEEWLKQK